MLTEAELLQAMDSHSIGESIGDVDGVDALVMLLWF